MRAPNSSFNRHAKISIHGGSRPRSPNRRSAATPCRPTSVPATAAWRHVVYSFSHKLYTALATKARAIDRRSLAGRPTPPLQPAISASMRIMLNTATNFSCFSVNGPNSSCSAGNNAPLQHPQKWLQLVTESKLHKEGNPSGSESALENPILSRESPPSNKNHAS
jgi:hypothetical protein